MQNYMNLISSSSVYLLAALLVQFIFFGKWSLKFFGKHEQTVKLFRKPIVFSIWVVAFFYALESMLEALKFNSAIPFLLSFKTCLLIAAFAFGVRAYKAHFINLYKKRNPLIQDATIINGIDNLLSVAIFLIATLLILDTLGFKSGPLLAFGGVGAAALGFAAKDVISNFFGGFMLVVSRPFSLGDLVLIPERKIEAHVMHIGWYMTTLKDKSKRFIYLPNSAFVNAYIVNSSRRTHRRIDSSIMIKACDMHKASFALSKIRAELEKYPRIDTMLKPYASLESCEFDSYKLKISAYTEIKDEKEFYEYQEKLLLGLCDILKNSGLELQNSQFILSPQQS
jgi:MscS family membrane protein